MKAAYTFLYGVIFAAAIFTAYELVHINEKSWCEIEFNESKAVAECTVLNKGLARVSFK